MHRIASLLFLSAVAAVAQPEFEVAAIKPAAPTPNPGAFTFRTEPGQLRAVNVSLRELFRQAYRLQNFEISGEPDWMKSTRFDVNAKSATASNPDEIRVMLRKLLADRFQLKYHVENKEIPAFVLLLAKGGPKFPAAKGDPVVSDGRQVPGGFGMGPMFQKVSMETLARMLSGMCGMLDFLPVIDKTGLKGEFDVRMKTPDFPTPDPDGARRSIYDTYCEVAPQIGLEFKRQKVAMDIYIIDSAEKTLTAN